MATVTWVYPADGGVVGLPFTAILQTDTPGATVDIDEPATGRLLGSGVADASGVAVIEITSWGGIGNRASAIANAFAVESATAKGAPGAQSIANAGASTSSDDAPSVGVTAGASGASSTNAAAVATALGPVTAAEAIPSSSVVTTATATINVGVSAAAGNTADIQASATLRAGVTTSAATAMTSGGAATATTASGSTALIPSNPTFDAAITANTEQAVDWWNEGGLLGGTAPGSWAADHLANAEMTGSYVGRLMADGYPDDLGYNSDYYAGLLFRRTAAEIDATTGILTFDARAKSIPSTTSTTAFLEINAYDINGVLVSENTNLKNRIAFWGTYGIGVDSDTTTFRSPAPVVNTTQAKSLNVKTWLSTRYKAGKSWSDVSKVVFRFIVISAGSLAFGANTSELYIDNFR